jgi:hypothetical protein
MGTVLDRQLLFQHFVFPLHIRSAEDFSSAHRSNDFLHNNPATIFAWGASGSLYPAHTTRQ